MSNINTNPYAGIQTYSRNGMTYVRNASIPSGVSHRKRFASRLLARKLNISTQAAYNRCSTTTLQNGTKVYYINR